MSRKPRKRRQTHKPHTLVIRTYQVGFGDCFLLTFEYDDTDNRHVLIDFGTVKRNPDSAVSLDDVAQSIRDETGGKLHIVVATHRHKDHISGFGLKKAGKIIEDLKPDVVIQPWTEDPDIPIDATAPARSLSGVRRRLANMNRYVDAHFGEDSTLPLAHLAAVDTPLFEKLSFIGEDNLTNAAAVNRLMNMGEARRAVYTHAKRKLGLKSVLPGVAVDVLGPPTLKQQPSIKLESDENEDEFWHMHAAAAESLATDRADPFPDYSDSKGGWDTKWTRYRLKKIQLEMAFQLVRILDKAMNNTSVILLFQAGGKSFLFPGDAQWENWSFALSDRTILNKLAKVDVYKVGHHGSLNATPKTLWRNFEKKGGLSSEERLISFLSTLKGKYGSESTHTEVPRKTLVTALEKNSDLVTTEAFGADDLFEEVRIPLR